MLAVDVDCRWCVLPSISFLSLPKTCIRSVIHPAIIRREICARALACQPIYSKRDCYWKSLHNLPTADVNSGQFENYVHNKSSVWIWSRNRNQTIATMAGIFMICHATGGPRARSNWWPYNNDMHLSVLCNWQSRVKHNLFTTKCWHSLLLLRWLKREREREIWAVRLVETLALFNEPRAIRCGKPIDSNSDRWVYL